MDFDIHGVLLLVWLCNGLSTSFVLNAVVQHHTQEFRCGDHVCHDSHDIHGNQRCLIEMRNVTYLHLRCHNHIHHDILPCSPNLLGINKRCYCDTRTCVDHTLISLVSGHQVTGLICSNDDSHVCHARQVCQIVHDNNGQLGKHCVDPKHLISHLHECRHLLNEQCYCTTQECVFGQFTGHQVAALICSDQDDHSCHADQVCRLHNTNGHLSGQCFNKHNEPYKQADRDGCPHILGEGHECFCNNNDCVQQTQAATGHHTVTTTNHNDLVCGDHVCHGHQYCIIEEKQDGKLYLKCADVHNTQHCLPNLLSLGSSCFCDTRTCVDHTLISIFAGHQVAGLICSANDDHSCHADKVCEISIDNHGIKKYCGDGKHMTQCTQLPTNFHEKCYCTTQSCVFGHFSAPTIMSTSSTLTTAGQTAAASTTIQHTTVQPTMVQSTTSVATTDISSITVALTNTPMVQAASSIPTTTVVTAVTSSTNNTCTDDEDSNFSCVVYEMMYGLCYATTGTLFNIAQKRCQAFCGICAASLPTQPTCIDHDARCSQFQFHICSSNVSQNYVISTCPKSCNKCAEYLAFLNPQPVTTTAQPVINTAQPVTTKAQQVTTTANPITTTPKPVTKTAAPTTTAQSVTTTTVVCQDKPGVDCKLFNIDFCANPYSNTICAKSCGHCSKVIQSAFG